MKKCEKCSFLGHYAKLCRTKSSKDKADAKNVQKVSESADGVDKQVLGIVLDEVDNGDAELRAPCHESVDQVVRSGQGKRGLSKRKMMRHMTYDARSGKYVNTWENRRMMNIQVGVTVDKEQYQMLAGAMDPGVNYKYPVVKEMGVADTGASVCCSGTAILNALKLSKEDLLGTEVCLYAADRKKLNILGV